MPRDGEVPLDLELTWDACTDLCFATLHPASVDAVLEAAQARSMRLIAGKKIWQAHSEHCYQKAVRAGKWHDRVVIQVAGLNMLLIMLAVQASLNPNIAWMFALVAYGASGLLMAHYARLYRRARDHGAKQGASDAVAS